MADPFGTPRDITTLFPAAFDREGDCGHDIYEGDMVAYVDSDLVCEDCHRAAVE